MFKIETRAKTFKRLIECITKVKWVTCVRGFTYNIACRTIIVFMAASQGQFFSVL